MNISDKISKAIREGKWIDISYINKNNDNTYYWIAVKDIIFESKQLIVSIFNYNKSIETIDAPIYFDKIQSAEIINFSSYEVPDKLIEKIESNLSKCSWLNYDHFNNNVLNYYIECNRLDSDPSQKEYNCVSGIDLKLLRKNKIVSLSDEQVKQIIKDIYHYDLKNKSDSFYTLAINVFSIDEGKSKFVVCYYKVLFDPMKKSLVLDPTLRFNQSFFIAGRRHSLINYINMNVEEFENTFLERYDEYYNLILDNLRPGEFINTRPEFMLIEREIPIDLEETYNVIETKYRNNQLSIPLKSFFGNISKRNNMRKKEPSLIIYDEKININQMRVLYNALKYPITYVQGPPGTGKTQTIINVVLSAFFNDKTTLVCSSNNKPVDGIIDKLKLEYRGEKINFPFLRLGNKDDVIKATLKIKDLFNYSSNKTPKEELLNKIKLTTDDKNNEFISMLNTQEKRLEIEDCLYSSQELIDSFQNNNSRMIDVVKGKIEKLKEDLKSLPEITNDMITSLFVPLTKDFYLQQYLFYKSLQYIEKLKRPRYTDLISICSIEDDSTRAMEFNKWTQNDDNMKKLVEVFPVIFSTNISSRRLGTPNFMFDLVVMDEAGQCNIATALLPIAKASSLLLVGDPNQLKPVIVLEDKVNKELMREYNVPGIYNYCEYSILDVMLANDNISKYILLKYHYRCGKKIINFSNQRYYNNSLNLSYIKTDGELKILDVKNKNIKNKNEAYDEACAIVDYIQRNNLHDAYIITPFVNQKDLIKRVLKSNNINDIDCGTIHSLQGAEKDTIIFSAALSPKTSKKTYEWIKNNYELINVAVTRAKNKLIIAADTEALEKLSNKKDDMYNLIQYAKNNGKIEIPPNESIKIEIGKSNGSTMEDEFFKTISHFCSCHRAFKAERNVSLNKLFKSEKFPKMEFDLVLYEKGLFNRKPVIAIEVNGAEHFGTIAREKSDRKKIDICKMYGIKLLFIPNSFVKAYEYIADIILASQNKYTSIQESLFS